MGGENLLILKWAIILATIILSYFFIKSEIDDRREKKLKKDLINYDPLFKVGDELTAKSFSLLQDPFSIPTVKIIDVKQNVYGVWFYKYEEFGSTFSKECLEVDKNFEKL